MKRHSLFAISILCSILSVWGQTAFDEANAYYAAGDYTEAIVRYDSLLSIYPSAELHYNIGNAYYKSGELAQSILHYKRALQLRPRYKDARYNLQLAQSRIIDNMEDDSTFFLSQWTTLLIRLASEQTWIWISFALFILVLCGSLLFAFATPLALRKTGFHTAWICLLFSIVCFGFAGIRHHENTTRSEAVIVQGIVNAKSSPDKSGTDLFILHEGTTVHIKSTLADWAEIRVGNHVGWIKLTALEQV